MKKFVVVLHSSEKEQTFRDDLLALDSGAQINRARGPVLEVECEAALKERLKELCVVKSVYDYFTIVGDW